MKNIPEPPVAERPFESLLSGLEGFFEKALRDLPDELRLRVENEFFPMPWDELNADQRRSVASQLDYQQDPATDPATEQDRQFRWNFFEYRCEIETQSTEWGGPQPRLKIER